MMPAPLKPETLKTIPVSAVHEFLTRRGWVQKHSTRPGYRYYEHSEMCFDNGKRMFYYFPDANGSPDYPLSVLDFIENNARFYDLDPYAVLAELQGGPVAEPVRAPVSA